MAQPLPVQKSNVFEGVNRALFPAYFYVRLLLNTGGIVLFTLLHADLVFSHDRWRIIAGLAFGLVSAGIVVTTRCVMPVLDSKSDTLALIIWLVSLEFLAPCVIIAAGMIEANLNTRTEHYLFWILVIAPDAVLVLLPRSVAGVISFYTNPV